MQITGIELKNWLTHRHLAAVFSPLTVVTGPNNSGKSSVGDAIEFAMTAALRRIVAKGDRPKLITEGADKGSVALRCGDVEIIRNVADGKLKAARGLPIGEAAVKEAVPWLLAPHDLPKAVAASPDTLRTLLLAAMRVDLSAAGIKKALAERGHAQDFLSQLADDKPLADWRKMVDQSAAEARGAWRSVTGETYGAVKAEDWQAKAPEVDHSEEAVTQAQADLQAARDEAALWQRELGAVDQAAATRESHARRTTELQQKALRANGLTSTLNVMVAALTAAETAEKAAQDALHDIEARLPAAGRLTCPHCEKLVLHDTAGRKLVPYAAPAKPASVADQANAQAAWAGAKSAVTVARQACDREQAELNEARAAADALAALELAGLPELADRSEAQASLDAAQARIPAMQQSIEAMQQAARDARRAQQATTEAANSHRAVKAWVALAEAISPSGVPGELLAKALGGFNDTMRWIAGQTQWRQVAIGEDMAITAGGRPYGLLSESEQWRAAASLAVALAIHSEIRFVVLDRMDVLEPRHRRTALVWLYTLTKESDLDTAIVIGTMGQPPEVPSDVSVIWLGVSEMPKRERHAA